MGILYMGISLLYGQVYIWARKSPHKKSAEKAFYLQ